MRSLSIVGYGVNGDPLRQGKLDLPELLETPTPDECDWARKFIARSRWREAISQMVDTLVVQAEEIARVAYQPKP